MVSAQSTVSTDEQNLILAQNNLELQKLLMKNALSRSIEDPVLAEADVIPTSAMQIPQEEAVVPMQDLINQALDHRAELVESRIDLNSRDLSSKAVRNAMLPTLDAYRLLRRIRSWRKRQSGAIAANCATRDPQPALATRPRRLLFQMAARSAMAAR